MPWVSYLGYERKPLILLVFAGLFLFLSMFDYLTLTSLPLLRTPSAAMGMILALAFAMHGVSHYRIYKGPTVWLLLLFVATMVVELLRWIAGDTTQLIFYLQWFQVFILAIILLDLSRDPRALPILLGSVVAAVLLIAMMGLLLGSAEFSKGRSGFEEINLNQQAYFYTLGLITLLWLLIERVRTMQLWQVMALLLGCAILMLAILKSGSRGGFLSMMVGITMLLILEARSRNTSAYIYVLPPVLFAGLGFVLSTDLVIERLQNTVAGQEDMSRFKIWYWSWQLIAEKPLMGQGPDFMELLGGYLSGVALTTHNAYLHVAISFGIPALILWLGFLGSVLRRCWQVRHTPSGALLISLVVTGLWFGLTGTMAFNRYFWVTLALAANVGAYQLIPLSYPTALVSTQANLGH
ncbi:O-antigen ligase family protein [Litchfieldella rifensis]|uniref:O-antigen ligase family protein n=1 Tax=Litchfieldella rifensis TaxID=762643 RepID=A0ABV7LSM3_9GAMM